MIWYDLLFTLKIKEIPLLLKLIKNRCLLDLNGEPTKDFNEVYKIDLSNNNLNDIPSVIKLFKNAEIFNFSNNNLGDFFNKLSKSNHHNMKNSNLLYQRFGINSKNLYELNLSNNNIENFPFSNYFGNITKLNLSNNNIENMNTLSEYTNFEYLLLSNNKLSEIPKLSNYHKIKILSFNNNNISLADLSSIQTIEELHLSGNNIENTAKIFGWKPYLKYLDLSNNKLKKITKVPERLNNLKHINLSNNQIHQMHKNFLNENLFGDNLRYLDLSNNQITIIENDFIVDTRHLSVDSKRTINLKNNFLELSRFSDFYLDTNNVIILTEKSNGHKPQIKDLYENYLKQIQNEEEAKRYIKELEEKEKLKLINEEKEKIKSDLKKIKNSIGLFEENTKNNSDIIKDNEINFGF